MSKTRSALFVGLMVAAAALAGYMVSRQLARPPALPALVAGTAWPVPRAIVPFTLTDHRGAPFDNARLAGQPSLVFFGFTHCPDVCPNTLALMAQLSRERSLETLRPLFITVDPARDDQQAMQRYVDAFGGGTIGLRGEDPDLEPLLANLGAPRMIEQRPDGNYFVDHSATLYYLNARGDLAAVFTPPFEYAALRTDLAALIASGH